MASEERQMDAYCTMIEARLAEADALLLEARETIYALAEQQAMPDNWYCPALDRIDAHLSREQKGKKS